MDVPGSVFDIVVDSGDWSSFLERYSSRMDEIAVSALNLAGARVDNVEISLLLTDDKQMKELNLKHRNVDKPTNVLSFEGDAPGSVPDDMTLFLGSIAVGYQSIEKESAEQGKSFADHMMHIVLHGVLHLLGYDHESEFDCGKMESLEVDILKRFNVANPYE